MTVSFLQDFNAQAFPSASLQSGMSASVGEEPIRRARRNDPSTSKEAAAKAEKFATSHAGRVLFAIKHAALTAHEIGALTGLTVVQIDRRLPELQRAGLACVVQQGGVDLTRGGYRVWSAA